MAGVGPARNAAQGHALLAVRTRATYEDSVYAHIILYYACMSSLDEGLVSSDCLTQT